MAPVITPLAEIVEGLEDRIALATFADPCSSRTSFSLIKSMRRKVGGTLEHLGVSVIARRSTPRQGGPSRRLNDEELTIHLTYVVRPQYDQRDSRRGLEQAIDLLSQAIETYQIPAGMPPTWQATDREYDETTGEIRVTMAYELARFAGRRGMRL